MKLLTNEQIDNVQNPYYLADMELRPQVCEQAKLANKLMGWIQDIEHSCRTANWECEWCGHDLGMRETNIYWYCREALKLCEYEKTEEEIK